MRAQQWWDRRQSVPAGLRGPLAGVARMGASILAPGHKRDQLDKLSEVLGAAHEGEFYRQFVSYWKDPAQAVIGAELPPTRFDEPSSLGLFESVIDRKDGVVGTGVSETGN